MKILHVFLPFGKVNEASVKESYIRFVSEHFNSGIHYFTTTSSLNNNLGHINRTDDTSIKLFDGFRKNLLGTAFLFSKFDRIIYHALSIPTKVKLFFMLNPKIMNRIVWVAWGYDLYEWERVNSSLKNMIYNVIEYRFRRKIKYFVGIFPPDIDYFKEKFKSKAQTFYASYVAILYNPLYKKKLNLISLNEKILKKDCINILIGNRSKPILNHIEVLDDLAKFKDEKIKIYIPLSYGDKEYGNKVEEKARIG